ncbi:MAG: WbqC family protein [Anaerolineales bacterium]|nr:WbqC family protein [Anaerolineales bacterium]
MIVSIHQPHFLPWMGYFNKILNSDAFVVLNTVQYRTRYYQNRAKVRRQETWQWVSIPVRFNRTTRIDEVTVADDGWREYACRTIEYTYHKTPHFDACWPLIRESLLQPETTLDDVNYNLLLVLLDMLDIHVPVQRANRMPVETLDPTDRLVELSKCLGATHYISGRGGRDYMRVEAFEQAGIEIIYQDLDFNTITYPQQGKEFLPGLSIIDAVFNVGPEKTRQMTEQAWSPSGNKGSING